MEINRMKSRREKNRLERIRQAKHRRFSKKNELLPDEVEQIAWAVNNFAEGSLDKIWEWKDMSKRKQAKAQLLYDTMVQAKKLALEQQEQENPDVPYIPSAEVVNPLLIEAPKETETNA